MRSAGVYKFRRSSAHMETTKGRLKRLQEHIADKTASDLALAESTVARLTSELEALRRAAPAGSSATSDALVADLRAEVTRLTSERDAATTELAALRGAAAPPAEPQPQAARASVPSPALRHLIESTAGDFVRASDVLALVKGTPRWSEDSRLAAAAVIAESCVADSLLAAKSDLVACGL